MNSLATNIAIMPGIVALLLFLVFTYLYEQSRQGYFRAWQLGWGAYSLHFAVDARALPTALDRWRAGTDRGWTRPVESPQSHVRECLRKRHSFPALPSHQ